MTPSNLVVANITYLKDGPTELHVERLIQTAKDHSARTGIAGYAEVSSNDIFSLSKGSVHADEELRKSWNKGLKATLRVQQLLTGASRNNIMDDNGPAAMTIGETSVVGGPPADCHARDITGITSFEKVDFTFPTIAVGPAQLSVTKPFWSLPTPIKAASSQYLHFSCPTLKIEDAIIDSNGRARYDSISVVSGNCLFSNSIISACDLENGSLELAPLKFSRPTIYEIEYIARASPAIADLACTVLSRNRALGIQTPLSINLDIPNWHYYKAVDEKLESGLCTANDALRYLEGVERRYDQISSVFETAIRHECALRGEDNPVVNISSRYNVVTQCIKSALTNGTRPNFETVMQRLDEQEDGIWRQFYELVPVKERPRDFMALGHLFYVFQVMKAAFRSQHVPQSPEIDFEPSLQYPAPEEMSICLPGGSASDKLSPRETEDFLLGPSRSGFGAAWSQYRTGHLEVPADDEDDNELSFDASSTVDIRVVSPETWASTVDEEGSDFEGVPESLTIVEETSASAPNFDQSGKTVMCRSPRLIGDVTPFSLTASRIFHLPPATDAVTSAACMLGDEKKNHSLTSAEVQDDCSHDAMLSTFEAASSFCVGIPSTASLPSSDDEVASHGFMLPSPVLSRSFWTVSSDCAPLDEAVAIVTDDGTSHAAMLVTHVGRTVRKFDMDVGITEDDGTALDDIVSSGAMISIPNVVVSRFETPATYRRRRPASKDELLSGVTMSPMSGVASNHVMAHSGWDMAGDDSDAALAAHSVMIGAVDKESGSRDVLTQPAGGDEHSSSVLMLPSSEVASSACMIATAAGNDQATINDDGNSHSAMLSTFEEPNSLLMAMGMCMAAAMTPLDVRTDNSHMAGAADESDAHAAMLCGAQVSDQETVSLISDDKRSDDAVVSHFVMLPRIDQDASSECMGALLKTMDLYLHLPSATMPVDDHVSHTAMMCGDVEESSVCMAASLPKDHLTLKGGMTEASVDIELASHAAMRGIVDLSSSFCMAETLLSARQVTCADASMETVEDADHHVVMLPSSNDEDVSSITMLFSPADEEESHAAMIFHHRIGVQLMTGQEQASHIAMVPVSIAPFFVNLAAKLPTILENTADAHSSHAVMVPTSNDEIASHELMLMTSTDGSASHDAMRPTTNDEAVSHVAMVLDVGFKDSSLVSIIEEDHDSHSAMLTSSMCMAATLTPKARFAGSPATSSTCTRASSIHSSSSSSSSSSSGFVKLPAAKKNGKNMADDIKKPQVLILSIDDNSERKIYSRSQKLLKKLRASPDAATYPTLVEAYLMRRVFINGNAEGSNLYLEDPSPEMPIGDDGRPMEGLDVVRELYGVEAAENLGRWFRDVGLGL